MRPMVPARARGTWQLARRFVVDKQSSCVSLVAVEPVRNLVMTPMARILIAFVAGMLLGAVYFATLRNTLGMLASSSRPFWVYLLWFVARFVLFVVGFLVVWGGGLNRLVACLSGFLIARALYVGFSSGKPAGLPVPESSKHKTE